MKLTKNQRSELHGKFGGRCAYCGCDLPERWHADHLEAVRRGKSDRWEGSSERPQNHNMDNMMPSCPPCNLSKAHMPLEAWREWIAGHVISLNSYHPIYRLTKAYGLVVETGNPVIFYFEKDSK